MKLNAFQKIKYVNMFRKYLNEYGSAYSDSSRKFVEETFLKLTEPGETPDILVQLYAKFGMLSDSENIYLGFSKMIGEQYGWNTKILEVGGGYYPIFSKYIDDAQKKNGKGTITVMDPVIVTNKLGRVKLQKEEFSHDMNVSQFDLLVGICPCEATTEIIKSAVINQKEFFIAMCGCTHFPMTDMPWFYGHSYIYRMWVEEILYLAREQEKDGFIIHQEMVDNFPYPIIYSKTKK